MPSPHTAVAATVTTSNPVRSASALSTSPPASDPRRLASPSPKSSSLAPRAGPNSSSSSSAAAAAGSWNHYYASASNNRPAVNTVYPTTQHIASAIAHQPQAFSAASLPRTSSLLPPPRITPDPFEQPRPAFQNPFDDQPAESLNDLEHLPPQGRTSSVGGQGDGFRNLNRWSASSASSRASPTGHQKPPSRGRDRRTSVDIVGGVHGSPRKLHKRPPSASGTTAGRPAASTRVRQESPVTVAPLEALPHIAALPPLEGQFQASPPEPAPPRPQREAPVRRPSDDPQARRGNGPSTNQGDTSVLSAQVGSTATTLPGSVSQGTTMLYNANGESGGHSRSRSGGPKSGSDGASQSKSRDRSGKHPSQKAMLSKALQRANMAVQLDNAQNPEGARSAYSEACDLLKQVLVKTPGEEDRKKLEAIVSLPQNKLFLPACMPPDRSNHSPIF